MPAEETQLLYSLCLHGRGELGLAPDEYAALTMVLLRLLAFKPQAGSAEKKSPLIRSRPPSKTVGEQTSTSSHQAITPPSTDSAVSQAALSIAAIDQPAAPALPVLVNSVGAANSTVLSSDLPPWEDLPDTSDDEAADRFAASLPEPSASHEAAQWRSLPVRQSSDSARVDVPKVVATTSLQTTAEGDVWFEVVQGLVAQEAITALVRELALQSQLVARDADQWLLRIERESLNHAASRERLQAALAAAGHGPVRLQLELGAVLDCPAKRMAVAAAAKMSAAQELIENDPLVQSLVREFGAKIVPGSLKLI